MPASMTLESVATAQRIEGVRLRPLSTHTDERGALTELFRESWDVGCDPVQWNFVSSDARVLRGVHVHVVHTDYLAVLQGHATIGLQDLRPHSPTYGTAVAVDLASPDLATITIPPGVAHGFMFHTPSLHLYGVSHEWDTDDELGLHWADPGLAIPWPDREATVSSRDAALPSLPELMQTLELRWRARA